MIASRSYGVADFCKDRTDCLACECGSDSDSVAEVEMLSEDLERAKRIGSKARCDVLAEFKEKDMVRAIDGFVAGVPHEEFNNH